MSPDPVYKDAITRILDLMRATFGDYFRAYYEGDPLQIPKANFPCVIAEIVSSEVSLGATGTDDIKTTITLTFVFDKSDDYGSNDNHDQTERKLRKLMEARDPGTGYYHPQSVMGMMRSNLTLQGLSVNADMSVEYDVQPRAGDGEDAINTSEAVATFEILEHVYINQRN